VKTKSAPQSMHFNILSWNSIERAPFSPFPRPTRPPLARLARGNATSPLNCLGNLTLDSALHTQIRRGYSGHLRKKPGNGSLCCSPAEPIRGRDQK
jgi:hypothetical protein